MEIVLLWCFVIAYFAKRGAEDLVHAVKGTPNPRYELKRERARAAGQVASAQPRYGTREWFADLYSDALVAHTEKRRRAAAAKAQPVDDMVDVVREPQPARNPTDPNNTRTCATCKGEVVLDGRPCPRCLAEQQRRNAEWEAEHGRWDARRKPGEPEWLTPGFDEVAFLAEGARKCPRCGVGLLAEMSDGSARCPHCDPFDVAREAPEFLRATEKQKEESMPDPTAEEVLGGLMGPGGLFTGLNAPMCHRCGGVQKLVDGQVVCSCTPAADDHTPTARIYQFPNINQLTKEIDMSNPEATGLPTAIAFAEAAAQAHASFSTAGSEGYAGALERMGFGEGITALVADAREKSTMAADSWKAVADAMGQFQTGREFYANNPDAPEKVALVNE
ncbi:hypothetical protein [Micromonospora aurantiaca (nom. illeg.)]|uniref:hypothetical protein n=1 Tax=Micromonospora aurantiaca (nom. illeg.) TaxID=47850 RepID=UPI003EBEC21C